MSEENVKELANVIYHEARGESRKGQIAVGYVVLNRKRSPRYPNTLRGVIWQRFQFQNLRYHAGWRRCEDVARAVLEGSAPNPIADCMSFRSNSRRKGRFRIGNHVFF